MDGLPYKNLRRREPDLEIVQIRLPLLGAAVKSRISREPGIGDQFDNTCDFFHGQACRHVGIDFFEHARKLQQYMILDQGERSSRVVVALIPSVMKIQRSAMIDEPHTAMP